MSKLLPTKQQLLDLYADPAASATSIGRSWGVSPHTIKKLFREYDIPLKTAAELTAANANLKPRRINDFALACLNDASWLHEQSVVQRNNIESLALQLGVSVTPIVKALKKFDLYRVVDGRQKHTHNAHQILTKEWLYCHYIEKRMTGLAIAELLGLKTTAIVYNAIKRYGIELRPNNERETVTKTTSAPVQAIADYIRSLGVDDIVLDDRFTCKGLELDILIPSHKMAIEFHGLYHHIFRPREEGFSARKGSRYHIRKTEYADDQGIKLIQLYADEWAEKPDIVKSMISNRLGKTSNKIHARNCVSSEITKSQKSEFLNTSHIQGNDRSHKFFGLWEQGTLVAVMTFARSIHDKQYDWILNRFSTSVDTVVVGGFTKLLKHATSNGISGQIVSYADRRISSGNVYEKAGFAKTRVNPPSYYYTKKPGFTERFNRRNFMKSKLLKLGAIGTDELSMAESLGFYRIYDCGTITYLLQT